MLDFFRKKKQVPDLSGISTDMHSHLLPGIDDGSPDPETSISLIRGMLELGYKKFITTPHIMWDVYQNTAETIGAAHSLLQDSLKAENMDVDIRFAAEYFIDDYFSQLLDDKAPLLTLSKNLVLVEISFITTPFDLKGILFQLQLNGYQPVLAHPERYLYMRSNRELFDTLKDAGCLFQLNLLSLAGYYGKPSIELAHYLIKKNYVDLLGTDLHHQRHLDAFHHYGSAMETVQRLLDSGKIRNSELL
jgi:protein-tyrosine phosphatase